MKQFVSRRVPGSTFFTVGFGRAKESVVPEDFDSKADAQLAAWAHNQLCQDMRNGMYFKPGMPDKDGIYLVETEEGPTVAKFENNMLETMDEVVLLQVKRHFFLKGLKKDV